MNLKVVGAALGLAMLSNMAFADIILPNNSTTITVTGQAAVELWNNLRTQYTQPFTGVYQKQFKTSDNSLTISCTWTSTEKTCSIVKG